VVPLIISQFDLIRLMEKKREKTNMLQCSTLGFKLAFWPKIIHFSNVKGDPRPSSKHKINKHRHVDEYAKNGQTPSSRR
jgi:hypothetical protein